MTLITYLGSRLSPMELTVRLNHEVVAAAANDSDCVATEVAAPIDAAQVLVFARPH